ncbi:glycoside hydrolase [Aureobasidium sp. EXF-3400]|nr:glycoside hydrolase [Aureobasidium sp. EXF-12344]KAI4769408.1 glycoside hydrolase [Aureobasidium sp. EXF-3400]
MMRTGVAALGALSLINLASAKPNGHHRRHQQLHEKRQEVVYETDYTYVTTQLPNVVVYVDENGAPYSTSTEGQAAATSAAAAVVASSAPIYTEAAAQPAYSEAASSSTEIYVAPTPTTLASVYNKAAISKDSTTQAPASSSPAAYSSAAASSSSSSKAAASSPAASNGSGPQGYGIVYSPYTDAGGCKSQDQVNSDFEKIMSYASANGDSYDFVRTYGTDCDQVSLVLNVCEKYDLKIFAGVYNIWDSDSFDSELSKLTAAAGNDWSRFNTISIGNEVVNQGKVAAGDVAGKVQKARGVLNAAGYSGKIVAVDTLVAMVAHPELCKVSDYIAVNAHPFFDGNVAAENSGEWLLNSIQEVSSVCGGGDTWITETGWPTQGSTNGKAVPSVQNQKAALSSMKSAVSSNVVWFTAFNDMWKTNSASTFNAEQYWGMCN